MFYFSIFYVCCKVFLKREHLKLKDTRVLLSRKNKIFFWFALRVSPITIYLQGNHANRHHLGVDGPQQGLRDGSAVTWVAHQMMPTSYSYNMLYINNGI